MSDPQPPVGEPIEEPRGVDDVVGSANEGLADAEAARTNAGSEPASARPSASDAEEPVASDAAPASTAGEPADAPSSVASDAPVEPQSADEPAAAAMPADTAPERTAANAADENAGAENAGAENAGAENAGAEKAAEPDPWDSPEAASLAYTPEYSSPETVASTAGATSVASGAASEPAASEPIASEPAVVPGPAVAAAAAAPAAAHQPIFVQAPEAPRPRGNRGAAGAIGLVAAASFAVLFLAVWFLTDLLARKATFDGFLGWLGHALTTWTLWVPVVVFFIAFWLLGAIINRGRWGLWVILGLLVGFVAYGGYLLGVVCQAPFWMVTASEARRLVETHLLAPLGIASFIIARELTIWFGAWVAARGRRVTAQNIEAQREYERTLEAGPQLHVP